MNWRAIVQPPCEHPGEPFGHVLNDEQTSGEVRRKLRTKVVQGIRSAGRYADGDNSRGPVLGGLRLQRGWGMGCRMERQFGRTRDRCHFDLDGELSGNLLQPALRRVCWLGNKIK